MYIWGAISCADDITIICPSIRGLDNMLNICNEFAQSNKIIFNSKNTICIKFGDKHITPEKAFLNSECLYWTDNIRHLENFIDCSNRDMVDCGIKKECLLDMLTNYVVIMTLFNPIFSLICLNLTVVLFTVLCYGNIILKVLIKFVKAGIQL